MLPSWKTEMLSLPELTTKARLLTESTAMAPGMVTFVGVAGGGQFAKQTAPRPFLPVPGVTMAARCKRDGSRRENSLSFGLKENAVLEKGWKATSVAPSSREPVV